MRLLDVIAVAVVSLMVAGGCVITGREVIDPNVAEDVGEVLEYKALVPEDSPDEGLGFRFVRGPDNIYRGNLVSPGMEDALDAKSPNFVFRRLGRRGNDPVYLVQFSLRELDSYFAAMPEYYVIIVDVRPDGYGSHAFIDCSTEETQELARTFGIRLECVQDPAWSVKILNWRPDADVAGFLEAAMGAGLLRWEDEAGISFFYESL